MKRKVNRNEPCYCVTAINRLTRQREVVTPPLSYAKAEAVLRSTLASPCYRRSYIYPTVSVYQTELFT